MARACSQNEGRLECFQNFIRYTYRKETFGEARRRWEDNIKMDLEEIGNAGNWVDSAQDRNFWRTFVNAALNHRVS